MPSRGPDPRLPAAFGLRDRRYIYLLGGGGKTSLMFALARALASEGQTVLTTTTTRILTPDPEDSSRVVIAPFSSGLAGRLQGELRASRHVTAASSVVLREPGKLAGFEPESLDGLFDAGIADYVLVEADGAAGRSLKAHRVHEPVLSARAAQVIAVIGLDCLGAPIDERSVHRAALFCERLGVAPGAVVGPEDVAAIFFHPEGYLRRVASGTAVTVFISKARDGEALHAARRLARTLAEHDRHRRIGAVVIGDLKTGVERLEIEGAHEPG